MSISTLDWSIIIAFFLLSLLIGLLVSKRAGSSSSEYFLSGRSMPWWLLGISMVATTFSADTPNLVTDIVRKNGVAGNWAWWAFLLTGMLTVFIYARLWRRSGVFTDLEFYELRYSGKTAAFLRGFRALYLGFFFNVMIMATVCLAAIKIGGVLLGIDPIPLMLAASLITVVYSALGGLRGVIITDFFQFIIAMVGAIGAAVVVLQLPQVDGLQGLLQHEAVRQKLNLIPDPSDLDVFIPIFLIPLAVQWWSVWYPGAEPGGGGYIAQRMLAAKDERHATGATLLFNIMHYAVRPWPWILVALASLIVFPDHEALRQAFPHVQEGIIADDLAYPAMLTFLPKGLMGIALASLIAAFMSTISTHLNWGSSYIVHDWYQRFVRPDASERELVLAGRISTVLLMLFAAVFALWLESAFKAFNILLQIGAGTGLIFILRWFWWRVNAYSELAGMIVSFLVAVYLELIHERLGLPPLAPWVKLLTGVGITTAGWLLVTWLTRPTRYETLLAFYRKVRPASAGWTPLLKEALERGDLSPADINPGRLPLQIACMLTGTIMVYAALFGTGFVIYGHLWQAVAAFAVAALSAAWLIRAWHRLGLEAAN